MDFENFEKILNPSSIIRHIILESLTLKPKFSILC